MTILNPTSIEADNSTSNRGHISSIMDTYVAGDRPAPTIAQTPSFCELCNVKLSGLKTWRAHVKGDGHVYQLRLKMAELGSVSLPPPPRPPSTNAGQMKSTEPTYVRKRDKPHVRTDQNQNVDDTTCEPSAPNFVPGKCLFCAKELGILDDNMAHMAVVHSFSVPFQDWLTVDIETVVCYIYFVIYGYRECICCGTQRSTIEGVQQHMMDKGHCRFDVTLDTEEFYEMPQSENSPIKQMRRDGSLPVRLPSGKLITHRKNPDTQEPRIARLRTPERDRDSFASRSKTVAPGIEVAQGRGGKGSGEIVHDNQTMLAVRLSKLSIAGKKAQHREEGRKRGRLEKANNTILFKHFRLDSGDSRIGCQF